MKCFIFRNNTVENIWGSGEVAYSGYGDISYIPEEAKSYIWFYQMPLEADQRGVIESIGTYSQQLQLVLARISSDKTIYALTLFDCSSFQLVQEDTAIADSIQNYNAFLKELSCNYSNLKWIDISRFFHRYARSEWIDWKYYFISQMALNPRLSHAFKEWFDVQVDGILLKRKKCLVLDLDNTLWGGVLGEDGISGIQIGGDYPGKAFLYFQKALLELSKTGVILTVCSKNNENDVLEVWEKNPYLILREKDFSAWKIDWNNKADNIQALAEDLNIGLDSMVFVDDNPSERELVKQHLPMVEVPDFPDKPYLLPLFFMDLVEKYFATYHLTSEDKCKTEQYKANFKRDRVKRAFTNLDDFILNLDIEIEIYPVNDFNISRISQMTQKTNQFNLTTRRYSETDIKKMTSQGAYVFCMNVKDRFGDNGIVGCIILDCKNDGIDIDSFLLSCRVLGKGIEFAFIKTVLNWLYHQGYIVFRAQYIPTLKNVQVSDFYDKLGFVCNKQESGTKYYEKRMTEDLEIAKLYNIKIK